MIWQADLFDDRHRTARRSMPQVVGTIVRHNPHGSFQGDAFAHIKFDNGMTVANLGCEVEAGQQIGTSGKTNSEPHLHFETWPGEPHRSKLFDPTQVFGWNKNNQIICRVVDRQRAQRPSRLDQRQCTDRRCDFPPTTVGQRNFSLWPRRPAFHDGIKSQRPKMQANLIFKLHDECAEHDTGD
jgi:hypothetical protein